MTSSTRLLLKSLALLICLFAVQSVVILLWALSFDGCTKYVSHQSIRELEIFIWRLWGVSLLAYLLILLFFLSDFARRPKFILQSSSITTFALLSAWKMASIAHDVQSASMCGQARDFVHPTKLAWLNPDLALLLTTILWGLTIVFAIRALIHQTNTQIPKQKL